MLNSNHNCLAILLCVLNAFLLGSKEIDHSRKFYTLNEESDCMEFINLQELTVRLIFIIWDAANSSLSNQAPGALGIWIILSFLRFIIERKEDLVVKESVLLLTGCVNARPELIDLFFSIKDFDKFIKTVLVDSPMEAIRREMFSGILGLCSYLNSRYLNGGSYLFLAELKPILALGF